jgi:hypothetical protein
VGDLAQLRDVSAPAALGDEAPTGSEGGVEAREEGVVVGDPVEDCIRERRVDRLIELELDQVGADHLGPLAERRPGALDHRRRGVDRHYAASWKPLEQHAGDPSAAAAGVEHGLVASQVEAIEHRAGHLDLRVGEAVVGRRVPVPDAAHSAVVTGPRRSRSRS